MFGVLRPFALVPFVLLYVSAAEPLYLIGTVTNTTNKAQITSASAVFSVVDGGCTLTIGPPMYGSGGCSIVALDERSGAIEIVSMSPLASIRWTGLVSGDSVTGTYAVEYRGVPNLPETGRFEFKATSTVDSPPILAQFLEKDVVEVGGVEYLVFLERDTLSFHQKDGTYVGRRVILDKERNPLIVIEDFADGSRFKPVGSDEVLLEWVRSGDDGYFVRPQDTTKQYLDRFFQPTGWSSFESNAKTLFARQDSDGISLFDSDLNPLGIRSAKTSAGRDYWMATKDGITEYFDESLKPLNWYSFEREGNTYFARIEGKKKLKLYDANLNEIRLPKKEGFWSKFGKGMAIGLAAYGQALQQQQAAAQRSARAATQGNGYGYGRSPVATYGQADNSYSGYQHRTTTTTGTPSTTWSNTHTSNGQSYSTTTQRLGNTTFRNTNGSGGYHASSTTQSLGNFDFINGNSSAGSFSGTNQRLGNFQYSNMNTPSGTWNGTSQQIGNFTYHNFTGPDGQRISGTTQRIGNFIYTNIH